MRPCERTLRVLRGGARKCPGRQREKPAGQKFGGGTGVRLAVACSACRVQNLTGRSFENEVQRPAERSIAPSPGADHPGITQEVAPHESQRGPKATT